MASKTGKGGVMLDKARQVRLKCTFCPYTALHVLQAGQGTPECPRCGTQWLAELGAEFLPARAGRGRKPGQKVGAYAGAVKLGSENMQDRASTGKSQAEFAALCGISERTLRTWESRGEVSLITDRKICAQLALSLLLRPAAYRCDLTGSTWSGRGSMPVWLRAALAGEGRKLSDFAA